MSQAWPGDVSQCRLSIFMWSHTHMHTHSTHHCKTNTLISNQANVQISSLAVTQTGPVKSGRGDGCVGMKSQEWGTGFRPFSGAAYTLMSKSSLCVAMGTRATLTKGEQKSERHRKTRGEEKKKRAWKGRRSWWGSKRQRRKRKSLVRHIIYICLPIFIIY